MIKTETVLQDRYLIKKQIGEGGMGAVYLAIDQRFDNYVAIKETFYKDDEFGEAFEREAKILNGLIHPVLPHVSDYFTESGGHFLVMQFIEGEDVSEILKRDGAFPVRNVLRWFHNLLDALDYLHSRESPIIHRDIKPQNLKLTPRGDIFLLDFGLAKLKKEDLSGERSVFGYSRKYSPLEQIQGIGTDARSDLFALAATVYHLFTGKPPVDAIARASSIVAGKPDPIELAGEINPEIPESIANVLNIALSLNAENRFVSANAMQQALKHAVQGTAWENIETLPESLLSNDEFQGKVINSAENSEFPALAAFAAESADVPSEAVETGIAHEAMVSSDEVKSVPPVVVDNLQRAKKIEVPIHTAPRRNRSRLSIVALIALIAVAVSASAFFIFRNPQSGESSEVPSNVNTPEEKTDQPETAAPNPVEEAKILDSTETENNGKDKIKPVEAKKTIEKASVENEPLIEEVITDKPGSKLVKTANKNQAAKSKPASIDRRERIVDSEQAPDIESIFTGRPSWQRNERMRRRAQQQQQIDEMSEEEFREMRRQQRERRRRRNAYPIPF
jgi:serine/threonine protein kinase